MGRPIVTDIPTEAWAIHNEFPRQIRQLLDDLRPDPKELRETVLEQLDQVASSGGFRAMLVSASAGDGVSTCTEAIQHEVIHQRDHHSSVPAVMLIRGNSSTHNATTLDELVPRRTLIRLARDADLLQSGRLTVIVSLLAFAVVSAVGVLTSIGQDLQPPAPGGWSEQTWRFSIAVALGTVAGVVTQLLTAYIRWPPHRITGREVVNRISGAEREPVYSHLIARIADELRTSGRFRCVIVDDLSQLDLAVRAVVSSYMLETRHRAGDEPELWVIFETYPEDPTALADSTDADLGQQRIGVYSARLKKIADSSHRALPTGIRHTSLYDLLPLDEGQRVELAARLGHPERATFRTIKAILGNAADAEQAVLDRLVRAQSQQGVAEAQALRILYWLALDALVRPNVRRGVDVLISELSSEGHLTPLLEAIIGTQLRRSEVRPRLNHIRRLFLAADPRDRGRSLSVDLETAEVLRDRAAQFGLPSRELGHLYWAMYWHDRYLSGPDAPQLDVLWASKIKFHLLQLQAPRHFARLLREAVGPLTADLFNVIVNTVRPCLRLCQVNRLPELLDLAKTLIADSPEDQRDTMSRRLRRLARDCYFVLRDDRVLALLLDMESDAQSTVPPPEPSASPMWLFAQSVASRTALHELDFALRPGRRLGVLEDYANHRGSWLALSLEPFIGSELSELHQIVTTARNDAKQRTQRAVEALRAEPTGRSQWQVADHLALITSLWNWALAGDRMRPGRLTASSRPVGNGAAEQSTPDGLAAGPFAAMLHEAYEVAASLRKERRGDGQGLDLVTDALVVELLTTTLACALFAEERWADIDGTTELALQSLGSRISADLELWSDPNEADRARRQDTASELERQMTVLQATWHSMGFRQLATDLAIRRAQFALIHDRMTVRSAALSGLVNRSGMTGLLSNAVLAEHADGHTGREHSAVLLIRGVTMAMAGDLDQDFLAELCMMAVRHSQGTRKAGFAVLIDHLLTSATLGDTYLDRQLDRVPDAHLDSVALWLTNVADFHSAPERLIGAVRKRIDRYQLVPTSDPPGPSGTPSQLENALACIDLFELKQALAGPGPRPNLDAVLDTWARRRTSTYYPGVLNALQLDPDYSAAGRLLIESGDVLRSWPRYHSTHILHLAVNIAQSEDLGPSGMAVRDAALAAVEPLHRFWENMLAPAENISILLLLWEHRPENFDHYRLRFDRWNAIKLRIDLLERVPLLRDEGQSALLFLDHARMFQPYRLPMAGEAPPAVTAAWLHSVDLSTPLIQTPKGTAVSLPYFVAVHNLFRRYGSDPTYAHLRAQANESAQSALVTFYSILTKIDSLSDDLRVLLKAYEREIQDRLNR